MDYAIYKTVNGKNPRVIRRFTQEDCNHRAKKAAQDKMLDMWIRVRQRGYTNADGSRNNEFSYDHMASVNTTERIRFYIAKL